LQGRLAVAYEIPGARLDRARQDSKRQAQHLEPFESMNRLTEPSCRSCPLGRSSSSLQRDLEAGAPEGGAERAEQGSETSPVRVVSESVAYFLLPLISAVVAAAAVDGESARIAAGGAGFGGMLVAVVVLGRRLRASGQGPNRHAGDWESSAKERM